MSGTSLRRYANNASMRKHQSVRFALVSLEYLGHIVGRDGIKVDPRKVSAVVDWPIPKDVHRGAIFPWS